MMSWLKALCGREVMSVCVRGEGVEGVVLVAAVSTH